MKTNSGKFVLRISPKLHSILRKRSEKEGISLNTLCSDILSSASDKSSFISSPNSEFISKLFFDKLLETWKNKLCGIILFGSVARQEQTDSSDIDLLLVLKNEVDLTRELYREWDNFYKDYKQSISPQFVKLPKNIDEASGLWYEVAIQGIVLWQSDKHIFYILQDLREAITQGKMTRHFSHGHSRSLIEDYLFRSQNRLAAVDVLFERKSWADVVRESQKIVDLALKALLKHCNIEVPRIHDVSEILRTNIQHLPTELKKNVEKMSEISRDLRRDRELSFYGSEDLTPSQFYKESDAKKAKENASWIVQIILASIGSIK